MYQWSIEKGRFFFCHLIISQRATVLEEFATHTHLRGNDAMEVSCTTWAWMQECKKQQ
jgi:hypothetical protein